MKVLVAKYMLEANCFVPNVLEIPDFDVRMGQDCIDRMQMGDVFEKNGIEVIPSVYARSNGSGIMSIRSFEYIEGTICDIVRKHINEIDGIFLFLHGASEVQQIGSGDHHILQEVRKIVGPYLPIAVVCDPHGNLCKEYVENTTIIRSYRHSPHTDIEETVEKVCLMLIEQMKHRTGIHSVYRKLPLILGGEQSVSTDEPVKSINAYMDEMEKDPKILSASWHVGYIRHDTDVAGCGIVVVPSSVEYQQYAEKKADELAEYVWNKRHEFHYTGTTAKPDEALKMALEYPEAPVFITDSGDNVTSRARGANTVILREVMALKEINKKIIFASIMDDNCYRELASHREGDIVDISLGKCFDELSAKVDLKVRIKKIGTIKGSKLTGEQGDFGGAIVVNVVDTPVDIIVAENNHVFSERHQMIALECDWFDYDIIVGKMGYAFPELVRDGKLCIMSLTDGVTVQDITRIPFKRIMRPMYPIDNI
ncbi:MAG: M81 family metallopeptidase [Erysipelotrichaceae bacterium]|nr:M81 family metallopeptidase [Erysipelotrichaceae bacterium]